MSEEEINPDVVISFSILVFIILLGFTIGFAYILERTKFTYLHETFLSTILGALVGALIKYSNTPTLTDALTFDTEYFFFLLLPPIIFNAGYDLKRRDFFRNFGSIMLFAFIGTCVAAFVTTGLVYAIVLTGWVDVDFDFVDCLVFGAVISATDAVTVLAIFHALHIEPKLFALAFGESILNDAVAIVLFETVKNFHSQAIDSKNILIGFGTFVGVFVGSFAVGTFVGCFSALVFKHTKLHENPILESGTFVIFAYIAYLFAQGIGCSGIVAMLFAGICMAHYSFNNLSIKSQQTTKYMFQLLSFLSENFIFTYLGVTIFTKDGYLFKWGFIFLVLIIILIARAANIVPISTFLNLFQRKKENKISWKYQLMMWWAGLRGAMAFALSLRVEWEAGPTMVTTTLMIVIITIALFGTPTATLLRLLGIKTGVTEDNDEHIDPHHDGTKNITMPLTKEDKVHWFISFDRKYLKPFFTRAKPYVDFDPISDNTEENLEMEEVQEELEMNHVREADE